MNQAGPNHRREALLLAVAVEGGMLLVALPFCWLVGVPILGDRFDPSPASLLRAIGLGCAAALPMLALFLAILWRPIGPFTRVLEFLEEFIHPLFKDCSVADLGLISLLAGFGEEMLFRAGLQAWLERGMGPWWALGIASMAFGLMHPISLTYVVLAALLGAYLGAVWMLTGDLIVVAVAHGLYDFLILLYLLRSRPAR